MPNAVEILLSITGIQYARVYPLIFLAWDFPEGHQELTDKIGDALVSPGKCRIILRFSVGTLQVLPSIRITFAREVETVLLYECLF